MDIEIAPPARTGESKLDDGRRLGWAEWGPRDGVPVLLCPGVATSSRLGFGTDVVDALGVRLVSADRPGLGRSDPAPHRTLTDWADDVRRLATLRELDGMSVVGFSAGAPFALACAASGLPAAAAIVSGSDELAAPEFASDLSPQVRDLVATVRADPVAAKDSFARFATPEALWEMITSESSAADRVIYQQPLFETAFRAALADALAAGPSGYLRDTTLLMDSWPFDPADITVPVDLWYGQQDSSPVHSPNHGATLTARIPTAIGI